MHFPELRIESLTKLDIAVDSGAQETKLLWQKGIKKRDGGLFLCLHSEDMK